MAVKGTGFLSAISPTNGLARYMFWPEVMITYVFGFCRRVLNWNR